MLGGGKDTSTAESCQESCHPPQGSPHSLFQVHPTWLDKAPSLSRAFSGSAPHGGWGSRGWLGVPVTTWVGQELPVVGTAPALGPRMPTQDPWLGCGTFD